VLGAFDDNGALSGFASFGAFRAWPAYKYSIEHSVYVRGDRRGMGLGKKLLARLIDLAEKQDYHMMIGGIDSSNAASVRLHQSLGFTHCASIKHAGFKFGRWLDLEFYQLLLPTPEAPGEE
jgi:phosphinothricin acetyltransferase